MLKKKATAFKPKARPRPNATPSQTPASSTNPSVERQTQTPAPLSQDPQSTSLSAETATVEETLPEPAISHTQSSTSVVTRENQPTSQPAITLQQTTTRPSLTPVVRENLPQPVAPASVDQNTTAITPSDPTVSSRAEPVSENAPTTPASAEPSSATATATAPPETIAAPDTSTTPLTSSRPQPETTASGPPASRNTGSRRQSQDVPATASNNDATSTRSPVSNRAAESNNSRPAKRRKVTRNSREDVRPTIEDEGFQPENSARPKRRRKPKDPNAPKRKRKRAATPDDAETQVVDITTTKMSELTKDLHIGKNFSMREKILERESERKEKARIAREKENASDDEDEDENGENEDNENNEANEDAENGSLALPEAAASNSETAPVAASSGPQLRIVDGVIVLDEASLQVDRHRRAAEAAEEMDEVEEDDFTRIVTSGTNQKKEKSVRWGHHDTEKFYEGLKMFGSDFEMIAKTFGKKRSRRQVKLKYNKEEVENPDRIHRCITGQEKQAMDLTKLKGGSKLRDTADIKAEIAAMEQAYKDEEERQKEELAEIDRRKKATITASGASRGMGGNESSKENETASGNASAAPRIQKKAPVKKSKRAMVQHMGGEDFEVVGSI